MKNEFYTVFYLPKGENNRAFEQLRVETKDPLKYQKAIQYAKEHNIEITRQYLPNDEIELIDFKKTINL